MQLVFPQLRCLHFSEKFENNYYETRAMHPDRITYEIAGLTTVKMPFLNVY
jgi:hypothetical protein